jgi:hypothetical protein
VTKEVSYLFFDSFLHATKNPDDPGLLDYLGNLTKAPFAGTLGRRLSIALDALLDISRTHAEEVLKEPFGNI